jgi:hypothetical protein
VYGIVLLIIAVDAYVASCLWPLVIPKVFPGLVANGFISGTVEFTTMFWTLLTVYVLRPANISKLFTRNKKEKENDK